MKIVVNRDSLLKALDVCSNAIGGKVLIDAHNYFLFDVQGSKCYVYGRNAQMEIKTFLNVTSKENFKFCIPAVKLTETVRLIRDDEVILTTKITDVEGSKVKSYVTTLTIKGKKNRYKNSGIDPYHYPVIKIGEEAKGTSIHMESLVKALANSQLAVDSNSLNGALVGVNLSSENNQLKITGAKNVFMYSDSIKVNDVDINMTIPKSTAAAITALPISPEAKIGTDGRYVIVKSGPVQITAILVAGKYPNTDQFVNMYDKDRYIKINRLELIQAMKVLKLYSVREDKFMTIVVNAEDACLTGENDAGSSSAEEVIEIDNHGVEEGFEISLSPNYVLPAISNIDSDNVKIHLLSKEKLVAIIGESNEEDNAIWIVFPVFIGN